MFEWDEEKRRLALQKHGLDFLDAIEIFQTAYLLLPGRSDIEIRKIAVGCVNESCIAVVFTMRDDTTRIITARKARRNEREAYGAHVARRDTQNEEPN